MEIKVYGPGCAKCKTTQAVVEKVIADNNLTITVTKVDDIMEMMQANILATPAVSIDGKMVFKGRIPSESEVLEAIKEVFAAKSCTCGGANC